jgi:hypothetical protein
MLRVADFKPHYVVVSLGIDTFMGDPLGDFCLTRRGYSSIGEIIGALQAPTMYSTSPPSLPPLPNDFALCAFVTRWASGTSWRAATWCPSSATTWQRY